MGSSFNHRSFSMKLQEAAFPAWDLLQDVRGALKLEHQLRLRDCMQLEKCSQSPLVRRSMSCLQKGRLRFSRLWESQGSLPAAAHDSTPFHLLAVDFAICPALEYLTAVVQTAARSQEQSTVRRLFNSTVRRSAVPIFPQRSCSFLTAYLR